MLSKEINTRNVAFQCLKGSTRIQDFLCFLSSQHTAHHVVGSPVGQCLPFTGESTAPGLNRKCSRATSSSLSHSIWDCVLQSTSLCFYGLSWPGFLNPLVHHKPKWISLLKCLWGYVILEENYKFRTFKHTYSFEKNTIENVDQAMSNLNLLGILNIRLVIPVQKKAHIQILLAFNLPIQINFLLIYKIPYAVSCPFPIEDKLEDYSVVPR